MEKTTTEGLVRGIGRWDLVALMINSMLGTSIFGLPGTIYARLGPFSVVAFLAGRDVGDGRGGGRFRSSRRAA